MSSQFLLTRNCMASDLKDIPGLPFDQFRELAVQKVQSGSRVISFFGRLNADESVTLFIVFADNNEGCLATASTVVKDSYPSLTTLIPQLHRFEREICEQLGIKPEGHPWLKPVRVQNTVGRVPHPARTVGRVPHPARTVGRVPHPARTVGRVPHPASPEPATEFFSIDGEEIHEVAVGPVHAGIIEPGHFRFQCHGEKVLHLEIALGYQHRGIEKALIGGPDKRTIHYMETLAGDTTIGHSLAYCQAVEGLSGCNVSLRACVIRTIMLELERLANHTGDLGAMAGDVGFLPTSSYCGRLRGDFLNMTALVCGNRFGRNMIRPGGVAFDLTPEIIKELKVRIKDVFSDVKSAISLLWSSPQSVDRFEGTGVVSKQTAEELGLVGVAARACGIESDARFDFPSGAYMFSHIPVSTCDTGDVFARGFVRWLEMQRSVEFILDQLDNLPDGEIAVPVASLKPDCMTLSLTEGWRGEICHVAMTDENGKFSCYKVVDPSCQNWMGLAMALRDEEVSDFPICNKSFSLSYCGHDL